MLLYWKEKGDWIKSRERERKRERERILPVPIEITGAARVIMYSVIYCFQLRKGSLYSEKLLYSMQYWHAIPLHW